MDTNPSDLRSKKMFLFYFVAFTVLIVLIFAVSIGSYYFDFYSRLNTIRSYLSKSNQAALVVTPQIHPLDPVQGSADAPITVIEFADLTCPGCKALQPQLDELANFYGKRIRFVFKGITITQNPENDNALLAAYCAGDQQAFWDFTKIAFDSQLTLSPDTYTSIAQQLKLDIPAFNSCLSSKKYESLIKTNVADALSLGITSAPTIYINNVQEDTVFSFNYLRNKIDAILQIK